MGRKRRHRRKGEAQMTAIAMREALVSEISRLTAEISKYAKEVEELQDEKKSIDEENKTLHDELTLARRGVERARLQGTMSNEEMNKGELQHRFEMERNIADQQKGQIDNLEQDLLEGQQKDSEAAARTYEAAISELNSRLQLLQSESTELQSERDELKEGHDELVNRADFAEWTARDLDKELKNVQVDMEAMREEYESRISEVNADMERMRTKYEDELNGKIGESNEQRDRAIALQKELNNSKKDIAALEGYVVISTP